MKEHGLSFLSISSPIQLQAIPIEDSCIVRLAMGHDESIGLFCKVTRKVKLFFCRFDEGVTFAV